MVTSERCLFVRHFRAEPTSQALRYRRGTTIGSERGAAFWFRPLNTAIAEIPIDDREQSFLFASRTADFQDVAVQGTITYRVVDAELAADRVDFGIDLTTGAYLEQPLERLSEIVIQSAQQLAHDWIARRTLDDVLHEAVQNLRPLIESSLVSDEALTAIGLEVAMVRVTRVSPTPELEKALQAPTRERLQQVADEATFQRRALAVDKERAIAENELANQIELTTRQEQLIGRQGANARRQAEDEAAAKRIEAESASVRAKLGAEAKAEGIGLVETAQNAAEQERIDIYRDLPVGVIMGLAAQELATKLETIEHLNLSQTPSLPSSRTWSRPGPES